MESPDGKKPRLNTLRDVTGRECGVRPDAAAIIDKYYKAGSEAHGYIVEHGRMLAKKAIDIAGRVNWLPPGMLFLEEAAMLHDIGIFLTDAPHLGCRGEYPYIAHGYLGRQLLEDEGYPLHALVCERHEGAGLSSGDIIEQDLPIPIREMTPITPEEEIICYADKLFPAGPDDMLTELSFEQARGRIAPLGRKKLRQFELWAIKFGEHTGV